METTGCARYQGTTQYCAEAADFAQQLDTLRKACVKENEEICQVLGKVLGYPWYKDDQKNFLGATEYDGVCVGDNVAITLAMQAAQKIKELKEHIDELTDSLHNS